MRTEQYISALRYAFCAAVLALAACTDDDAPTSGTLPQPPADPESIYSDVPIVIGAGMAGASAHPVPWGAPAQSPSTRAGEAKVFDGKGPLESGMTFNALIVAWEEADYDPEGYVSGNTKLGTYSQGGYHAQVGYNSPYATYTWADVVTITASAEPQVVQFTKPRYYRADGSKTHMRMIGPISDKLAEYWRTYPDRVNGECNQSVTLPSGAVISPGLLAPWYGWSHITENNPYDYCYMKCDVVYSDLVTGSKDDHAGKRFTLEHVYPRVDFYLTLPATADVEELTITSLQNRGTTPASSVLSLATSGANQWILPLYHPNENGNTPLAEHTYTIVFTGIYQYDPTKAKEYPYWLQPTYEWGVNGIGSSTGWLLADSYADLPPTSDGSVKVKRGETVRLTTVFAWEDGLYNKYNTTYPAPLATKRLGLGYKLGSSVSSAYHEFDMTFSNAGTPWPDHVGLKAGVAYRADIRAKGKEIEAQVSVVDWDTGGSGSVTVN